MYKEVMVYIHNEILFSHKRNEVLPFATTWINLEDIILNEMSQAQKDKYFLYVESKNFNSQKHCGMMVARG